MKRGAAESNIRGSHNDMKEYDNARLLKKNEVLKWIIPTYKERVLTKEKPL